MIHRFVLVCVTAVALSVGCAAGSRDQGKGGDAVVSSRLLSIFEDVADPADARYRARAAGVRTDDHGVMVDIQTVGLESGDRSRFERTGVRVYHFSTEYERVAASVRDLAALHALSALEPVRAIAPEYGADNDAGGVY